MEDLHVMSEEKRRRIFEGLRANSDITAGAFNKWTSNSELTEQEYYARDFEIRYPDEREENDDHAELIRLVNWVSDATDEEFKNNLEQYFNKEYLFKYFLNVMVFGQVDNLGLGFGSSKILIN